VNLWNFPQRFEPHLKFKPNSNWICFLDFYFNMHLGFELLPKRKDVPFEFIYHHVKFGNLWSYGSTLLYFIVWIGLN
jgi:hypothetical protein